MVSHNALDFIQLSLFIYSSANSQHISCLGTLQAVIAHTFQLILQFFIPILFKC